jgi:hypothetical protein
MRSISSVAIDAPTGAFVVDALTFTENIAKIATNKNLNNIKNSPLHFIKTAFEYSKAAQEVENNP